MREIFEGLVAPVRRNYNTNGLMRVAANLASEVIEPLSDVVLRMDRGGKAVPSSGFGRHSGQELFIDFWSLTHPTVPS